MFVIVALARVVLLGSVISIKTVSTPSVSVTVAFMVTFSPKPFGLLSDTSEIVGGIAPKLSLKGDQSMFPVVKL